MTMLPGSYANIHIHTAKGIGGKEEKKKLAKFRLEVIHDAVTGHINREAKAAAGPPVSNVSEH